MSGDGEGSADLVRVWFVGRWGWAVEWSCRWGRVTTVVDELEDACRLVPGRPVLVLPEPPRPPGER